VHALVSGVVQGVCFRAFVLGEARNLGLVGRVRNLRDGRVEVDAEGTEVALEALVRRLHQGPPGSVVDAVDVSRSVAIGAFADFQIHY
jgi:acylphosphatase